MKNNKGFTLVELMVVLLIIGILMSVAVVVFMGARTRAQDNVAKQTLNNAARAIAAYYVSESKFPADKDIMKTIEGAYNYTDNNSDGKTAAPYSNPPDIAYDKTNEELRVTSESGTVWGIDISGGQVGAISVQPQ